MARQVWGRMDGHRPIIPLSSVDYRKMLNEEKVSEKMLELNENFFYYAKLSQKYLKEKSGISELDKKNIMIVQAH